MWFTARPERADQLLTEYVTHQSRLRRLVERWLEVDVRLTEFLAKWAEHVPAMVTDPDLHKVQDTLLKHTHLQDEFYEALQAITAGMSEMASFVVMEGGRSMVAKPLSQRAMGDLARLRDMAREMQAILEFTADPKNLAEANQEAVGTLIDQAARTHTCVANLLSEHGDNSAMIEPLTSQPRRRRSSD